MFRAFRQHARHDTLAEPGTADLAVGGLEMIMLLLPWLLLFLLLLLQMLKLAAMAAL